MKFVLLKNLTDIKFIKVHLIEHLKRTQNLNYRVNMLLRHMNLEK